MMEILTSRKNATIQRVRKLLSSRKARVEEGLFVAEVSAWVGAALLLCVLYYRHIRRLPWKEN